VQGITGIPHYYKQFEYEMGLELGGGRVTFDVLVPRLKDGEQEPFAVRAATEADIPFLMGVYAHACKRSLVTTVRDEAIWRYDLNGRSERNVNRNLVRIIERRPARAGAAGTGELVEGRAGDGEPVGYLVHPWFNWNLGLALFEYELKPGVSWLEVTPSVARYALRTGREFALRDGQPPEMRTGVAFWHGSAHPVYEVWHEHLPRIRPAYAWYVRVCDLPGFLRHIAPALERRLDESLIPGYGGTLRLNLYRRGVKLEFEGGKFKAADTYQPDPSSMGEIGLPDLTVLQLVFGYRSIEELRASYADCNWENEDARVLVSALFPKKPSLVTGVT
jgi:hypothetical protein